MPGARKPQSKRAPARTLSVYRDEYRSMIELLKEIRLESGLKQEDVAAKLEVQQTFVSKIEIMDRRVDLIELRDLCAAYGVPLAEFVTRLETRLKT